MTSVSAFLDTHREHIVDMLASGYLVDQIAAYFKMKPGTFRTGVSYKGFCKLAKELRDKRLSELKSRS
jgi:hypothetical protein